MHLILEASWRSCLKWCNNWINISHSTSLIHMHNAHYNTISKHELIIFTRTIRNTTQCLISKKISCSDFFSPSMNHKHITYLCIHRVLSFYLYTKIKKMLVASSRNIAHASRNKISNDEFISPSESIWHLIKHILFRLPIRLLYLNIKFNSSFILLNMKLYEINRMVPFWMCLKTSFISFGLINIQFI